MGKYTTQRLATNILFVETRPRIEAVFAAYNGNHIPPRDFVVQVVSLSPLIEMIRKQGFHYKTICRGYASPIVRHTILQRGVRIWNHFNQDINAFKEWFYSGEQQNLKSMSQTYMWLFYKVQNQSGTTHATRKSYALAAEIIDKIYATYCRFDVPESRRDKASFELNLLRQKLALLAPPDVNFRGRDILRAAECVCCGADPTAEGQHVTPFTLGQSTVHLPLCATCSTEEQPAVDWERVARLYVFYSKNLEVDIERNFHGQSIYL